MPTMGNTEILDIILILKGLIYRMSPYTMGLTAHSTWRFSLPGVNSGIQHVCKCTLQRTQTINKFFAINTGSKSESIQWKVGW